jgi:ligand-binding sensor domain-containing protein
LTNPSVNALAVDGSRLFAGTFHGVFVSTNDGTNWAAFNAGLTSTEVWSLAVDGSTLFAGTDGGVFRSTDNGTSWTPVNAGLTGTFVRSMAVHDSHLFAGTYSTGVWRRPLSEMVSAIEDDVDHVPVGFTLAQNYPNPFWRGAASREIAATTIRYQLPKTTDVVLKIYNTFGQEVRTLVHARQPAGENAAVWDGKDAFGKEVSSGIYIYRLQTGASIQSRKMLFVRR